jgi:hypothetical protein
VWEDLTDEEIEKLPTEAGYSKFVLLDGKWHVKGRSQDLEGKGPFCFHKRDYEKVYFEKEQLKFVKRYLAKHNKRSNQLSYYICKYDLYEVVK